MNYQSIKAVLCHAGLVVSLFLCFMLVCSAAEGRFPGFSAVILGLVLLAAANLICGAMQSGTAEKPTEENTEAAFSARSRIRVVRGKRAA